MTAETEIRAQLDRWFAGWSPGQAPFDAEGMRPLFAEGEIRVIDDFGDRVVTIDSFDGYAATWTPVMAGFADWAVRPHETPRIETSGDLAVVTFVFLGEGVTKTGEAVSAAQHVTQAWRRQGRTWVIVGEHITSDDPKKFGAPNESED